MELKPNFDKFILPLCGGFSVCWGSPWNWCDIGCVRWSWIYSKALNIGCREMMVNQPRYKLYQPRSTHPLKANSPLKTHLRSIKIYSIEPTFGDQINWLVQPLEVWWKDCDFVPVKEIYCIFWFVRKTKSKRWNTWSLLEAILWKPIIGVSSLSVAL